jgi:hypothetical protein
MVRVSGASARRLAQTSRLNTPIGRQIDSRPSGETCASIGAPLPAEAISGREAFSASPDWPVRRSSSSSTSCNEMPPGVQQHQQMIEHIGASAISAAIALRAGNHGFHRFLAEFLGDARRAGREQLGRPAFLGRGLARGDDGFKIGEGEKPWLPSAKNPHQSIRIGRPPAAMCSLAWRIEKVP